MAALTAVATMLALSIVLASILVVANRWLSVAEDPRIGRLRSMLPSTNCGACGYAGCQAFAEALICGEVLPSGCSVGSSKDHQRIADFLGVEVGTAEKRVARLACAGGSNVARNKAHYEGMQSCAAAALVAGGGKACFWGCLGLADCELACDFDAIEMDAHSLPVVKEERCTACGDCVEACPKDLFSLHPIGHRLWVACSSLAEGDSVLNDCEVGCTGCGRCAAETPERIRMENSLPVIDYQQGICSADSTQRCPTGAIVWIDPQVGPVKGREARHVVRHGPLRDSPS